ncbi:YbaB/EbfC family nucleoid-associated protein [Granulicella cerasi]|uniref:Nucleoid-associated protein ACFQBQ_18125 n=1 Tax=Granulicella cerasi TaxID=741063 RepID=A0ABW1ZH14_9BACT|nr:YbaB/EbfC family nucleoid-associated protein [Granulicella cerasi]
MDFSKLGEMLSAAQDMKAQMDARLADTIVEADSGGGAISVRMNGKKELLKLTIAPAAAQAASGDITMLEDLIVAAVNSAARKAEAAEQSAAQGALGGMNLPGF